MFHNKGRLELTSFQRTSGLLWLCALMFTVSISEAQYQFTVRFFEFRNPLGLQCGECENGGPPACCDDVQRLENCNTSRPFNCDVRFRFLLRSFGAPVETAPNTDFPYFTPSNSLFNSFTFSEGPGGLLALPNPFTITRTETWTGRIQFFIDALDNANPMSTSGISETEVIINRFPINLELNPGPDFTERTTYTGIYGISDVGFDMSFRVQCLENYFGPNCTTFCEPLEVVYTCDSEGRPVCLESANFDPTTNCTTCLPNYDPEQNCTQCLLGRTLSSNCSQCPPGFDIMTDCTECLPNYDQEQNCTQCLLGRILSSNCSQCPPGFDIMTDCTECLPGYEFTSNQMECSKIPTTPPVSTKATTKAPTEIAAASGGADLLAVSGVIGTIAILLVILVVVLSTIMVVMIVRQKRQKQEKGLVSDGEDGTELATGGERDFENPLYDESTQGKGNNQQGQESPKKVDLGVELEESQPLVEAIDNSGGKEDATEGVTQSTNPPPSLAAEVTTIEASVQEGEDDTTPHEIASPGTVATESQQSAQKGTEYADIVISPAASLGPDTAQGGPAEHDYATTEVAKQPESMQQASADYTNTTPGIITQEALSHYDFGQ